MRTVSALCLLALAGSPAQAQAPKRMGAPESPIAASVEVPEGSRLVYVSGHSIGGALAELVSQFFGLKGFNIDGPGVQALTQHREFAAVKVIVRKEFPDLRPRYEFRPRDFVANSYSVIGLAGIHAEGVSYDGPMELAVFAQRLARLGDGNDT